MAFRSKCPVCRTGVIIRPDARTCSPVCASEWRLWSPQQRANAIESANEPLNVKELVAHVKKAGLSPITIDETDSDLPPELADLLKGGK